MEEEIPSSPLPFALTITADELSTREPTLPLVYWTEVKTRERCPPAPPLFLVIYVRQGSWCRDYKSERMSHIPFQLNTKENGPCALPEQ